MKIHSVLLLFYLFISFVLFSIGISVALCRECIAHSIQMNRPNGSHKQLGQHKYDVGDDDDDFVKLEIYIFKKL